MADVANASHTLTKATRVNMNALLTLTYVTLPKSLISMVIVKTVSTSIEIPIDHPVALLMNVAQERSSN